MKRFNGGFTSYSVITDFLSDFPFFFHFHYPIFFFIFFFLLSLLSFFFISFSLYKRRRFDSQQPQEPNRIDPSILPQSLSNNVNKTQHQTLENTLLFEILSPDSPKSGNLFCGEESDSIGSRKIDEIADSNESDLVESSKCKKKRKKGKKKKNKGDEGDDDGEERVNESASNPSYGGKQELVCFYPFTSSSSVTQRKIKQQYDQLVKCNDAKGLTVAQVGQFANCLIEARAELQNKSEAIQRKFTITKALLCKADRSSLDRLRQQIYKLELEQKRLQEDAFVYNWLQQQLKLSPAYKTMIDIGARVELKAKYGKLMECTETECDDISFEELLAQEKKDSFWQKNGKSRISSNY
uniref:AT1G17665-like protein n=1 Tax=Melianthus villosus TaxID=377280 RepID=A0A0G4AMW3_9ROSI|nr:AT1G17665-like protein [Melianthus villosus]